MKVSTTVIGITVTLCQFAIIGPVAARTSAGQAVTNTATITYRVGGIAQPAMTASTTFVVERVSDPVQAATVSVKDGADHSTTRGKAQARRQPPGVVGTTGESRLARDR